MKFVTQWFLIVYAFFEGTNIKNAAAQNPWNRKIMLQGFYWDFKNDSFPLGWANYLTELTPRLKEAGIEAIYVPVSVKNQSPGTGYVPFDHYDLGDKYQKGHLNTSLGNKNELLRMYAVMKANGMQVYQDVVWNHLSGAGSEFSSGGQDFEAPDDGYTSRYKNFRYVCYKTPSANEGSKEYLLREGRFYKNWQNFYPSPVSVCCTNGINTPYWGPDIDYSAGAIGQSNNALYNPKQNNTYMRNGMREWMIWYKKQTGFDGLRIDAVKHFPTEITEDFLWNLRYGAGWANGGDDFFAFSEWVDFNKTVLDNFCSTVQNRTGTFDFSLRSGIHQMVTGLGNFDLGSLVNFQQDNRLMTVPFVNNHDTYRPIYDQNNKDSAWEIGRELAPHINKDEPRWALAYAMILAVDGSPMIYFDDLFDIGTSGNRFNHHPLDTSKLKINEDLLNLIWCHNNLKFKEGEYLVRNQSADLLVIERKGKALIAMNDAWSQWQDPKAVQTAFTDGTVLIDYTGAAGTAERTVYNGGKVDLSVPPNDGSAKRKGYSIWAPKGITSNHNLPARTITQEWEMANDLGDRNAKSLEQSGAIPPFSEQCRVVGSIYVVKNKNIQLDVYGEKENQALKVTLLDENCQLVDSSVGSKNFTFNYIPKKDGWLTIKAQHTQAYDSFQKVWVKATYNSPLKINTSIPQKICGCLNGEPVALGNTTLKEKNLFLYPNPARTHINVNIPEDIKRNDAMDVEIVDWKGTSTFYKAKVKNSNEIELNLANFANGIYIVKVLLESNLYVQKFVVFN